MVDAVYRTCRASDKIIRWGGDEFVGIFEGMSKEYCKNFADKLLNAIASLNFYSGEKTFSVTVSLGFAYFSPLDKSYTDVISRADSALYESKANGKNTASGC